MNKYRCGYIAIIGRANAGKSTLVNALVGEKVAIVSPKPQTTRNNILGILTKENTQFIFVDTPGIHSTKNNLDKYMMKSVRSAISGVDIIVYVFDGTKELRQDDLDYVNKLCETNNVFIVFSKTDLAGFEKIYPKLAKMQDLKSVKEIIPLSALKKRNIDVLLEKLEEYLPCSTEKNWQFEYDEYTDRSLNFLVKEILREKTLHVLQEEIPHGIAIDIKEWKESPKFVEIQADLICEKDSHKNIIIGKNGKTLGEIGQLARQDIEVLLNKKVLLKIWVRVKKNWRDENAFLAEIGYKE